MPEPILPPASMKYINRDAVSYSVDGRMNANASPFLRAVFQKAVVALDRHKEE